MADGPLNLTDRTRFYLRLAAALLLGALMPLAFAPFSLSPLAILVPVLLLRLVQPETSLVRLFTCGWLFGIGYFGLGVYWIYHSLHDFGMAAPLVAAGLTGVLVVYLALMPGLTLMVWGYTRRHLGEVSWWLLPLFWFALEWFKGWFLTGMPWLSLGYSQTNSPLAGFAPLIGVYGISAICILLSVALYLLLWQQNWRMIALLILTPLAGWLTSQFDWTEAQQEVLKVSMVQGNIPQAIKWRRDQHQHIIDTYWRETRRHWDSDLILWPETALPGHSTELEDSVLAPLQQAAREQGSVIVAGLVVSDVERERYYNSAVQLGEQRSLYHKRHLVLFGEYYPMRWLLDLFSGLISIPYSDLTAGPRDQEALQVGGSTLGMSICFEDVFSRDVHLALPAANLLVNLSNDAWFGDSTAPHQHLQIAQMRSMETERVMMRATNTGVSAFIDHKGQVMATSRQFSTESLTASVQGRRGVTPFYYFSMLQGGLALLPFALLVIMRRGAG